MNELNCKIGKAIKEFRLEQKITQNQLAKASGVSVSAIQQIEYGKLRPKIETLFSILSVLNVDCDIWSSTNAYACKYFDDMETTLYQRYGKKHNRYHMHINLDENHFYIEDSKEFDQKFNDQIYESMSKLIENYDNVTSEGQKKIVDYSSDIADNPKYKKDPTD